MRAVSELLGHSDTRTTSEIYSHVSARLVAEADAAIARDPRMIEVRWQVTPAPDTNGG